MMSNPYLVFLAVHHAPFPLLTGSGSNRTGKGIKRLYLVL
jgi:hypothetical protein